VYGSGDGKELEKCRKYLSLVMTEAYLYSHIAISMQSQP